MPGYIMRGRKLKTNEGEFDIPYIEISTNPSMEFYVSKPDVYPIASLTYESSSYTIDESTYSPNNRLWLKHNGIRNSIVDNLPVGVEVDYLTSNGWRLVLMREDGYGTSDIDVKLYDPNNNLVVYDDSWLFGAYYNDNDTFPNMFLSVVESADYPGKPILVMCRCRYVPTSTAQATNQGFKSLGGLNDYSGFFAGAFPPLYEWTAWDQIAGNGGQYRCDLTKIKDDSIGDFSAIQTGDSSDFVRISSQSSIWNIFHNMGFDEVRKIAWSGGNYMTMKVNEEPEYPNQYTFTFSFYNIVTVGGEQTPSLIWQDTFPITWTGDPRDTDFYLSFVYDPEQEAALFVPITKDTVGAYEWGWSGGLPTEVTMNNLYQWLTASENPEIITPYTQGTEDNGGTPGGSLPQSHIDVPTAPELGAMSSGMFTLYCPTETELQHISQFLWSDNVIANIKKYFNNFSDNIMALYVLPYKPSNNPVKVFQVGNMASSDTELSAVEYIDDRFVSVDMGEVKIKPFWGSYLDYAPYSSLQVVLPGVGVQSLDVDDIFCPADQDGNLPAPSEATIHIDYTIDLMTGVIVAFISINGELRYQFPGKLGYQIPLTGENYVRMAQGFVTAAAGLIGTVVSGGTAAPFAAPAATAGIINAMKPDVYRGGNLSGDASMLARLTPTLIYRRPNKPLLQDQEEFTGFPSYKIGLLSEFSGYTEVIDAHVEGISCTDEERELILNALKEGVII